jgi:hypothetical protein
MAPVTRRTTASKTKGPEGPTRPVLKIKLTPQQVHTAVRLSATPEQEAAIKEAAAIETELRQGREAELWEALTRPIASNRVFAVGALLEQSATNVVGKYGVGGEEEVDGLDEETPLVYQSNHLMNTD